MGKEVHVANKIYRIDYMTGKADIQAMDNYAAPPKGEVAPNEVHVANKVYKIDYTTGKADIQAMEKVISKHPEFSGHGALDLRFMMDTPFPSPFQEDPVWNRIRPTMMLFNSTEEQMSWFTEFSINRFGWVQSESLHIQGNVENARPATVISRRAVPKELVLLSCHHSAQPALCHLPA